MNLGLFTGTIKNSNLRQTESGKTVCNAWLEIASESIQQPSFILPVTAWDELASGLGQMSEGDTITVEGYVEIEETERGGAKQEIITMTATRLAQFNTLSLTGRAGGDPEVKDIEQKDGSFTKVAKFRLAVDRGKSDGEASWFNIEVWGRIAETVEKYVRKGSQIGVTGTVRADTWTDRATGANRSKQTLKVYRMELLGSKPQPRDPETPESAPASVEKAPPEGKGKKRTRTAA
ncbi:single-stranded DNA-binding protein [Leptolyngbya ohadii]|uniref:single-stranded DNA-binding protein n=1 Tax=Leptolyngbya ohadii TaxID=1962290 RepID=UPI000B59D6F4|nr:single-stranded DNA-binding protein [Leptolyngbya ohadii]